MKKPTQFKIVFIPQDPKDKNPNWRDKVLHILQELGVKDDQINFREKNDLADYLSPNEIEISYPFPDNVLRALQANFKELGFTLIQDLD